MIWYCVPGSYPQQGEALPEGAVEVAAPPAYDPATQVLGWRGEWHVEQIPTAEVLAERISAVKAEASRRILDIAPDWKQRNLTARASELALLYPGTKGADLPEPERSEYLAGQAIWDRIKAVRSASNDIEASLVSAASATGATAADVLAVDVATGWPA